GLLWGAGKGIINKNKAVKKDEDLANRRYQYYQSNDLQPIENPYGNQFEDGGMVSNEQPITNQQAPVNKEKIINIQKGELMINPNNMSIVQEFLNPNRYSSHASNQFKEPHGNFVSVPEGLVIIPKKLANRFKKGDMLSKKSIVMKILSDQANDPEFNIPNENKSNVYQYANGGLEGNPDLDKPKIIRHSKPIGPNPLIMGKNSIGRNFMATVDITKPEVYNPDDPRNKSRFKEGDQRFFYNLSPDNPEFRENPDGVIGYEDMNTGGGGNGDDGNNNNNNNNNNKINWKKVTRSLVQNAPILAQMAVNAQGDNLLSHYPNMGYYDALALAGQLPDDVDISGALAANNRSYLTAMKGLDDNDSPSVRAEKAALLAEKISGDNTVYYNKQ